MADSADPAEHRHPRVGVGAFIIDGQERLLLVLRKKPPEAGYWCIPGGKVDFLETLRGAVAREVREELGVEIEVGALIDVFDHILRDENAHWVAPVFLAIITRGEARNASLAEIADVRYFGLDELPEKLAMPTRLAITAYRERWPG